MRPPSYLGAASLAAGSGSAGDRPGSCPRHSGGGGAAAAPAPGGDGKGGAPADRGSDRDSAALPPPPGSCRPAPPLRCAHPTPGSPPPPYSSEPRDTHFRSCLPHGPPPHPRRQSSARLYRPFRSPSAQPHCPSLGPTSQSQNVSQPLKAKTRISSQPPPQISTPPPTSTGITYTPNASLSPISRGQAFPPSAPAPPPVTSLAPPNTHW